MTPMLPWLAEGGGPAPDLGYQARLLCYIIGPFLESLWPPLKPSRLTSLCELSVRSTTSRSCLVWPKCSPYPLYSACIIASTSIKITSPFCGMYSLHGLPYISPSPSPVSGVENHLYAVASFGGVAAEGCLLRWNSVMCGMAVCASVSMCRVKECKVI